MISKQLNEEIFKKLLSIEENLKNEKEETLDDFISEREAKNKIGRKTTWFWERRRAGILPYTKLGGEVFYKKADLISLFKNAEMKGGDNV